MGPRSCGAAIVIEASLGCRWIERSVGQSLAVIACFGGEALLQQLEQGLGCLIWLLHAARCMLGEWITNSLPSLSFFFVHPPHTALTSYILMRSLGTLPCSCVEADLLSSTALLLSRWHLIIAALITLYSGKIVWVKFTISTFEQICQMRTFSFICFV